ncbi:WhiB family transcriptional regulator [Streptosporangium canum]|uniref:WhiB family transcriptional regulator n=1 Tax=Streptosporangium canum TaxID=324952 RepID=UPI0036918D87
MSGSYLNRTPAAELRTAMLAAGPACQLADAALFTGPDVFETENETAQRRRQRKAKKICATCPAMAECLAYALAICPTEGVWAGRSATAIRAMARQMATGPDSEQEVA